MNNKWIKLGILVVVIIAIFILYMYKQYENMQEITDKNEIEEENSTVQENIPIMKQYVLENCYYCNVMKDTISSLKEKYKGRFDVAEINVMKDYKESQRYNISQTPTQLFFDKDGKLIKRHTGYMSEEQIIEVFKSMGVE